MTHIIKKSRDLLNSTAGIVGSILIVCGVVGPMIWNMWMKSLVCQEVKAGTVDFPTYSKADTMIHQHTDPLVDSLSSLGRKQNANTEYLVFIMQEIAGSEKTSRATRRYLAAQRAINP